MSYCEIEKPPFHSSEIMEPMEKYDSRETKKGAVMKKIERKKLGLSKWKKEHIVVLFIIGVLLMVITLPVKSDSEEKGKDSGLSLTNNADQTAANGEDGAQSGWKNSWEMQMQYETQMEAQLKSCLEQVDGVGKVQVMITFTGTAEQVLAKDQESTSNQENTEDGFASSSNMESTETTVLEEVDGNLSPYVIKEVSPHVKGVFVVAEGGDDPTVKQNICDAVMALFSIESHKIMVVKMKEG